MPLHLIKLAVGCESVKELKGWVAERMATAKKKGLPLRHVHITRMTPKRDGEILAGGSLYWVIKGFVLVRQRVLDLRADVKEDGTSCCGIVLDTELVATRPHPRRAFQGWRYLEAADAPPDAKGSHGGADEMPGAMREELRALRLIDW